MKTPRQDAAELWVLLWSRRECALSEERLSEMLERNLAAFAEPQTHRRDHVVLAFAETREALRQTRESIPGMRAGAYDPDFDPDRP